MADFLHSPLRRPLILSQSHVDFFPAAPCRIEQLCPPASAGLPLDPAAHSPSLVPLWTLSAGSCCTTSTRRQLPWFASWAETALSLYKFNPKLTAILPRSQNQTRLAAGRARTKPASAVTRRAHSSGLRASIYITKHAPKPARYLPLSDWRMPLHRARHRCRSPSDPALAAKTRPWVVDVK